MMKSKLMVLAVAASALAACQTASPEQKGAVVGAAAGTGIGLVAGGDFGEVLGAGLIGGALGYVVGGATSE